jgi:hypothetical protein
MPEDRRFQATPETIVRDLAATLRKIDAATPVVHSASPFTKKFIGMLFRVDIQTKWIDPLILAPPAMRITFIRQGKEYAYTCAKWANPTDNLRACQRTIGYLYAIYEDYGVGDAQDAPEQAASFDQIFQIGDGTRDDSWPAVLGVRRDTADRKEIKRAYNRLALIFHPDRPNGDVKEWLRIDKAYNEALEEIPATAE